MSATPGPAHPPRAEIERVLRSSRTKREATGALGRACATSVRQHIAGAHPELLYLWRALPAGGAFAGRHRGLPAARRDQAEVDELVAEAAADLAASGHPLSPENTLRDDLTRLILAVYAITGTINFRRGWVRSVMLALEASGRRPTSSKVVRWHRCRLADDPGGFASAPGIDQRLVDDLLSR